MTKIEKRHLARVASLPCACCGAEGPSCVHHLRHSQGMAQRASHMLTVPLCHSCHQGDSGIHGSRVMMKVYKVSELDMLAATIEKMVEKIELSYVD